MKALNQSFLIILTLLAYISEACAHELTCPIYAYGVSPQIDVPGGVYETGRYTGGNLVVSMEIPDMPPVKPGSATGHKAMLRHPSCSNSENYARIVLRNSANTDVEWLCLPLRRDLSRTNYWVGKRSVMKEATAWLQVDHKFVMSYGGDIMDNPAYVSPVIISISNEPVVFPIIEFKGTVIGRSSWDLQDAYTLEDIGPGESTTIELPRITGPVKSEGRITQTGYSGPDAAIYINGERLTTSKVTNDDPVTVKVVAGKKTGHYQWDYNVELECD